MITSYMWETFHNGPQYWCCENHDITQCAQSKILHSRWICFARIPICLQFLACNQILKKLNHDKSLFNFYFSELGTGWAPAVLVTQDEHDFIKYSQLVLNDAQDYFIGGSAEPEVLGNFDQLPVDYPPWYTCLQCPSIR